MQASSVAGPQDIAGLIRSSIVEGTSERPAQAATVADTTVARPPSTLEAQAGALASQAGALPSQAGAQAAFVTPAQAGVAEAGGRPRAAQSPPPAPPSHLRGPMPTRQFPAAPIGAGYEIQIGAYVSAQEAQSKLDLVRNRAVGLLDGHGAVTLPVQRDDRQIFRARFVHFDERTASNACLELRRLAIDCFVMRAD
jgi:D-alanyl-D-alanine carboxypeptidase